MNTMQKIKLRNAWRKFLQLWTVDNALWAAIFFSLAAAVVILAFVAIVKFNQKTKFEELCIELGGHAVHNGMYFECWTNTLPEKKRAQRS